MATSTALQIASPPTTSEVALTLLQALFATTGVPTDFNIGSIIRSYSEAIGSVVEIEGATAEAQAFQALIYSAITAFGIAPLGAIPAVGQVTFSTQSGQQVPPNISVQLPGGTIVQTTGGIQFSTISGVTLVSGTTSINASIQAVIPGVVTNVVANSITQILNGPGFPLTVNNTTPTVGGADAELPSQTLSRFVAFAQSLGLGSPISIASALIGVQFQSEVVKYAVCVEPWITQALTGVTPVPGFTCVIDNGSGSASSNLVSSATTYLSSGGIAGFRPAGVPFSVVAVNPVLVSVSITAKLTTAALAASAQTSITQSVNGYFAGLNFGDTVQLSNLIAAVADVTFGQLTSLTVILLDALGNSQTSITTGITQRALLQTLTITVT